MWASGRVLARNAAALNTAHPMRIGFLFNHYAGHQLLHAAPTAFALSRLYPEHEVRLLLSSPDLAAIAEAVAARYPGHRARFVPLDMPLAARLVDPFVRPVALVKKSAALAANIRRFAELDILVVPEKTSLRLKREPELKHLKFAFTRHGAGDRGRVFTPDLKEFDLILAAGGKIRDRLIGAGLATERSCAVVGYPKFSVAGSLNGSPPAFDRKRPTVLYAPHYSRSESSWPVMGRAVLDFFRESRDYNLVFAPHVLLYRRWLRHRARPLGRWRGVSHIHLDTGSPALIDMTYTRAADLYLGDVSSQIYEFLERPRPCLFLDAHKITDWRERENFRMWHAGAVLEDPGALGAALERATAEHETYRPTQDALFAETFDLTDTPAEFRAAEAIVERLC